ncbi:MAG: hypothetical protein ABSH04_05720 [Acidimicrobiales bacterium]
MTLVVASMLLAVPFVALHHVNTIDGPAHVLGGQLLGSLGNAPVVRHYYDISFSAAPNVLTQLLLTSLMTVVSPTWAEKLVVVAYIVAFPLAVRYAIMSVSRSAGWLALISLPFVVSYMFLLGFYDFSYAMVGAMVAVGMAIRFRDRWTAWRTGALALVLVLTYAAHIVPMVMAVVIIATITVVEAVGEWLDRRADGLVVPGHVRVHGVLPPMLAILPVMALTIVFVVSGNGGGLSMQRKSLTSLVGGLATLTLPTVSYSRVEIAAALLTAVALAVLAILAIRGVRRSRPSRLTIALAVAVVVCIVVYFAAPDDLGTGSYLNDRLSLFPPLVLLLACASVPMSARVWRAAGLVALGAALVAAGARLPTQTKYDRLVSEYLTVERAIPSGATLVALRYSVFSPPLGDQRYKQSDPLAHEASRVAADKGDVDLRHLEGQFAYYPDRFRPHLNRLADTYLNDSEVPPHVDLLGYNQSSGRPVEYVLVVGLNNASTQIRNDPDTQAIERALASQYVKVMVTAPTGLVDLYRHR